MSVSFFFQMWQIGLTGNEASVSLYRKVRFFKTASLVGAFALGAYEMHKLQDKWTYYNRFYPEATELQKGLEREAFPWYWLSKLSLLTIEYMNSFIESVLTFTTESINDTAYVLDQVSDFVVDSSEYLETVS